MQSCFLTNVFCFNENSVSERPSILPRRKKKSDDQYLHNIFTAFSFELCLPCNGARKLLKWIKKKKKASIPVLMYVLERN